MSLLMLLVLGAVAGVSRFVLRSSAETIHADMWQSMAAQAQTKVSQLTVWYGALRDQALRLADSDPVRLFASEADGNRYDPQELLRMAQTSADGDGLAFLPGLDQLDGEAQLGAQAPLMRRQLRDFARQSSLAAVSLFNTRGAAFLSTNDVVQPAAALDEAVRDVLKSGQARTLPARLDDSGQLIMDMVLPVFAPLYVDDSGTKIVAALALEVDLTPRLRSLTSLAGPDDAAQESSRLLQLTPEGMQALPPDGAPLPLPGWTPGAEGNLDLAVRTLPGPQGSRSVYSMALPVPGTALFVAQDIPRPVADARYEAFRRSVLLSAALVSVVAALLLIMLWWWLLGRRDRAVAAELRGLYETVTRQNQIIDGVNTTMEDGIALSNPEGRFIYANQAFAAMVGETPASLLALTCSTLSCPDIARNIRAHTEAVRRADAPLTFTDTLFTDGVPRHFQVACSPFRNEQGAMSGLVSVYRDVTDLLEAQERARHMISQTVHVFVRAIEAVDPYLRGQSFRTGLLAVALAERLGLPDHTETLRTAANLSQIGMIQLPHRLLAKTGILTPEERSQLEKHVDYARDALEGIDFGHPVLEAITQMHERMDGSGYPHGLSGDAIDMDGRILAVAGTFCALLRPRSYRQARNEEQAMNILSSPQYDPQVVEALRAYLQTPEGHAFQRELGGGK